ncbi:hypothetical protein Vretimale_12855, partial [Volvox reticuliferus]
MTAASDFVSLRKRPPVGTEPMLSAPEEVAILDRHISDTTAEFVGSPSATREEACEALAKLAATVPASVTHIRLIGLPCLQQGTLHRLLDRCPRLQALEMPAAELPSEGPLCPGEHDNTQLVAQRLSRPAGAWTLQQLPASLTHLCLSECGSLHPTSLVHLRGLTALKRLSIRGLQVPPPAPSASSPPPQAPKTITTSSTSTAAAAMAAATSTTASTSAAQLRSSDSHNGVGTGVAPHATITQAAVTATAAPLGVSPAVPGLKPTVGISASSLPAGSPEPIPDSAAAGQKKREREMVSASSSGGDGGGGDGRGSGKAVEAPETGIAVGDGTGLPCCPVVSSLRHWSRLTNLQDVELVGRSGTESGEPWDHLLPAFLPSLPHLTRLAFHPPVLRDAAEALAPLEGASSLARLELGGCGAAPLQLHEGAWRALAAAPSLELLLLGHCDVAVGSALAASSEEASSAAGNAYRSAAASLGLAAAAASLSSWDANTAAGAGAGGGSFSDGNGLGRWGTGEWIPNAGGGGRWGLCLDPGFGAGCGGWYGGTDQYGIGGGSGGVPTTPEGSPVRYEARGTTLGWADRSGTGMCGAVPDDLLLDPEGAELSDLKPIQHWDCWDTESGGSGDGGGAAVTAAQSGPPGVVAAGHGFSGGAGTGTGAIARCDGWQAGVQCLGSTPTLVSSEWAWDDQEGGGDGTARLVSEQDAATGIAMGAQLSGVDGIGGGGGGRQKAME